MNSRAKVGDSSADRNELERKLSDRIQYAQYSLADIQALIPLPDAKDESAGIRGFLAFTAAADRQADRLDPECLRLANDAIRHPAVWTYVGDFYNFSQDIRDPVIGKPELHRVGTTSFVLKVENANSDVLALKLLKFRFCFKQSITDATRTARRPAWIKHWKQGDRYIEMSFVEGDTLAELISVYPNKIRANYAQLAHNLCGELETAGRVHGDLNPHNVIVIAGSPSCELRLIDFGVNYLLREGIGDADALIRASVYLAPEVIEQPEATSLGDVFALGVILLEMLSVCTVPPDSASRERKTDRIRFSGANTENKNVVPKSPGAMSGRFRRHEFDRLLDGIELENLGLATLIDDMLEPDPRLRFGAQQSDGNIFELLQKRLALEFLLRSERLSREQASPMTQVATVIFGVLSGDPTVVVADRLNEARKLASLAKTSDYADKRRDLNYLLNWSLVATISHLVVSVAFIYYLKKYSDLGRLGSTLPGLLILLSFSFVAVKYYQTIFGDTDVRDLGPHAQLASLWMRFCTFYWPPAILLVYYYSPEHWSIAASYGTGVVAINNYLTWRLANSASNELSSAGLSTPANVESWLAAYKGWYELMAVYAICLFVIGQLILHGFLQDINAYMVIILLVNFKLWFYNSSRMAPSIRNSLMRIFQRYRRLLIFKEADGQFPTRGT